MPASQRPSLIGKRAIKAALLQLHSVIGLVIALVLTVMGITGAIMGFEDEIEASLNADLMRVEARAAPMLTPDQIVARLHATPDLGRVAAVTMTSDPGAAVQVRFARGKDGGRPGSIYVDPYDAHVLGTPRGEAFFATVRRLHRWLLLPGDGNGYGRTITGFTALGLILLLISGLVLRWPHRAGSLKLWLKPNLALQGRGLHRSLHAVVGTWVMLIYLVIAATGLTYSFPSYKAGLTWLLSRPATGVAQAEPKMPRPAPAADATPPQVQPLALDRAWSTFLHDQGGRFEKAQLTLPPGAGTVIRIRSWARGVSHEDARDEFRLDAISGRLVSSQIYADMTIGERILANILDIHRGAILGWPGKLLFMIAAALMPLFLVTGVLLYLSRRKHRRLSREAARAPEAKPADTEAVRLGSTASR